MSKPEAKRRFGTGSPKAIEMSGALRFLVSMIALAIAGCATTSQPVVQEVPALGDPSAAYPAPAAGEPSAARQALAAAIRTYEDGQYAAALKRLKAAIALGLTPPDEVAAHKYLAFVHCIARRRTQCRNEFRLAMAIDPAFELGPAEAGHPLWGPVFRGLKARR